MALITRHGHTRIHPYVSVALGLLLFACSRTPSSHTGQSPELESIKALTQRVGFDLMVPSTLPYGVDPKAETDYDTTTNEATMTFFPTDTNRSFTIPVIRIREALDPSSRICPPCPNLPQGDLELVQLGNRAILVRQSSIGERRLILSAYFRDQQLRVAAEFDWKFEQTAPTVLGQDARQQAMAILKSLSYVGDP